MRTGWLCVRCCAEFAKVAGGVCVACLVGEEAAAYLRVCQAIGIVYQADGRNDAPGPIEDVLREIAELRRKAAAFDEAIAALRKDAIAYDAHERREEARGDKGGFYAAKAEQTREALRYLGADDQTSEGPSAETGAPVALPATSRPAEAPNEPGNSVGDLRRGARIPNPSQGGSTPPPGATQSNGEG